MSRFDDLPVGGDAAGNAYLVHAPRSVDTGRGRGALLGLAVGDAFGTTLEFQRIEAKPFDPPVVGPHRDVTGGGPFQLQAGQVTDDTQMATALCVSMMEGGGFKAKKVGDAYVAWTKHAFDIGNQTRATLGQIAHGTAGRDAGRSVWLDSGKKAAGNGSLMRTVPIALFYQDEAERRREVSMEDAAMTHFDPRCQLAGAAYNGAIAFAVDASHGVATAHEILSTARTELALAAAELTAREPADAAEAATALANLTEDLDFAEKSDPDLYGATVNLATMAGFVRVAFRLAFWQLLHAPTFEAALIDVVNRGGDADTNGAIAGGLYGAMVGEDGIPAAWRSTVEGALKDNSSPWGTTYHPRRLFALVR
ncbi:MAG: ADP-ribosyl-[dinitrogen reductase] hydrolase [Myxococcota bacterium]|jgi:ADP-ribosyl-[dinitrogen reductase] hydrolase